MDLSKPAASPAISLDFVVQRTLHSPWQQRRYSEHVRVCHLGYLPGETKFALLTSRPAGPVHLRRWHDNSLVMKLAAEPAQTDADSGDVVNRVEFSALSSPGTYYLDAPGLGASHSFRVAEDVFARAFRLAMRMFTGQRCGTSVDLGPDFPGYVHRACHLGDAVFHESSGRQGSKRCFGGWHDAGDYGRYVVNACVASATLLWAYELNDAKLREVRLELPEAGGIVPDMLAEIRWNLNWLMAMQDSGDGGVWHKATTAAFAARVMPEHDHPPTLIIGNGIHPYKTTQATADFAAVFATAARVYRPFDLLFADQCLAASRQAWEWLATTGDHHFSANPASIHTGAYADHDAQDERLWAAAELFRTTGERSYGEYFQSHYTSWHPALRGDSPQTWSDVRNLAMYAYVLARNVIRADDPAAHAIRKAALAAADEIVARCDAHPYRVALLPKDYVWGSNSVAANYAIMLLIANRISPDARYVNTALDTLHYLLGRNTFNTSFVTHVGHRWPMHPHHRPSMADGVEHPWPGMLVGGPNAYNGSPADNDDAPGPPRARPVPRALPARQWFDREQSFTTNEVAINWNAALVFLLSEMLPTTKVPLAESDGERK